jgi:nitrite reductase/ring-hydroxylating ferredoxin subunit
MKKLPVIQTDRRGFLKTTCAALCTLPLAGLLNSCETDELKVVAPTGKQLVINLDSEPALKEVGGAIQKAFPEINSGRRLNILRNSETAFLVVTSFCPHEGGTVELPFTPGENMYCDKHGAEFSYQDGRVLMGPAQSNLQSFEYTFDAAKNTLTIKY